MFDSLRNLLSKRAPHLKSTNHASLLTLKKNWEKVAKKSNIPSGVKPISLKKKKLTLACSSRAEASHVYRLKNKIQKEVNSVLEDTYVEDIRCEVRTSEHSHN